MKETIVKIRNIISQLNEAAKAYYKYDNPIMSDKTYDELYDELSNLERTTGIIMADSPTRKVQGYVLEGLKKVKHSKPMLSACKTKDIEDIRKFIGDNHFYVSMKLDGLTTLLRYENGEFKQGITRGNGTIGEDVTEACKFISNIPMKIPYKDKLELRGETVISWYEFKRINETLSEPYSHPRNLAAGTLRNLDLNVVKERRLSFIAFECVSGIEMDNKYIALDCLDNLGFETVKRCYGSVRDCVETMKPDNYKYPVDGLIFEIESKKISESLGATEHHENCRMALKWTDELYETVLRDVIWQTSKSGLINPVAVFEPVDLDGAVTTRATLHNISYIEDLELGIEDTIQIYRANMVIPKVHDNLTRSNTLVLPTKCPCCGGAVKLHNSGNSKFLICTNSSCPAKLLGKLTHFCSRDAININGMSDATLQKFIDLRLVSSFKDIYHLQEHYNELINIEGFGEKSVKSLLNSIEKSRQTTLGNFLYSLSIPLVGKTASKQIEKYCNGSLNELNYAFFYNGNRVFSDIQGFGIGICRSIYDYLSGNWTEIKDLADEFEFKIPNETPISRASINGKTFCVTGSVEHFKNRNELKAAIENAGGKVTGSVSSKTSYLVNNNISSTSSKNQNAKKLGIPIITENELISMLNGE